MDIEDDYSQPSDEIIDEAVSDGPSKKISNVTSQLTKKLTEDEVINDELDQYSDEEFIQDETEAPPKIFNDPSTKTQQMNIKSNILEIGKGQQESSKISSRDSNTEVTISVKQKQPTFSHQEGTLTSNEPLHLQSEPSLHNLHKKVDSKEVISIDISPLKQTEPQNMIVILPASSGAMPEAERESSESSPETREKPTNAQKLKIERKVAWQIQKDQRAAQALKIDPRKPPAKDPKLAANKPIQSQNYPISFKKETRQKSPQNLNQGKQPNTAKTGSTFGSSHRFQAKRPRIDTQSSLGQRSQIVKSVTNLGAEQAIKKFTVKALQSNDTTASHRNTQVFHLTPASSHIDRGLPIILQANPRKTFQNNPLSPNIRQKVVRPNTTNTHNQMRYASQQRQNPTQRRTDLNSANMPKKVLVESQPPNKRISQSSYGLRPIKHRNAAISTSQRTIQKPITGTTIGKLNEMSKTSINFRDHNMKGIQMNDYYQSNKSRDSSISIRDPNFQKRRASTSKSQVNRTTPLRSTSQVRNASQLSAQKSSTKRAENNKSVNVVKYPEINFKTDADFPIKILDSMIQIEEDQHNGFSVYNRGQNLKKCLINPERVKEFLLQREQKKFIESHQTVVEERKTITEKNLISVNTVSENTEEDTIFNNQYIETVRKPPAIPDPIGTIQECKLNFLTDKNLDDEKQWKLMLDYFKKNPYALLDALPTPPGEEEDEYSLKDFHSGLTPKRNFQFKFGQMDPSGALGSERLGHRRKITDPYRRPQSSISQSPNKPHLVGHSPRVSSAQQFGSNFAKNRPDSARSNSSAYRQQQRTQEIALRYGIGQRSMSGHSSNSSKMSISQTTQNLRPSQKDFRISKRALNSGARVNLQTRLKMKKEEMERQQEARRIRSDKLKNIITNKREKISNADSAQKVKMSEGNSSVSMAKTKLHRQVAKVPALKDRMVLEHLDWKKSIYYKNMIGELDDKLSWHLNEDLLMMDELDILVKLIASFRQKKAILQTDELFSRIHDGLQRGSKTIEYLHKEILQEQFYAFEYDQVRANDPYTVKNPPRGFLQSHCKIFTLERMITRIFELLALRKDIKQFLIAIHEREIALEALHTSVNNINSDEFFVEHKQKEEIDAYGRKVFVHFQESKAQAEDQRQEMLKLGNQLVTLTENVLKQSKHFFRSFNRRFSYVRINQFVFQGADYLLVAVKEVEEISAIFSSYDLTIKEFDKQLEGQTVDGENEATVRQPSVEQTHRANERVEKQSSRNQTRSSLKTTK